MLLKLSSTSRVREIACQAIIEGTAVSRLSRALKTRTLPHAESHEYAVGDTVEHYRPQSKKDSPAWIGPAIIKSLDNVSRGTIVLTHADREVVCRVGDVRRQLEYLVFLQAGADLGYGPGNSVVQAWQYIRRST